jgi:hypothetical protein
MLPGRYAENLNPEPVGQEESEVQGGNRVKRVSTRQRIEIFE